jgi:hypothetical protein
VVFMGMGEPFHNYDALMDAVRLLNDPHGFALGHRHITISTIGLVPQIDRFADEGIRVNLAISLHAPTDEQRSKVIPPGRCSPRAAFCSGGQRSRPFVAKELGEPVSRTCAARDPRTIDRLKQVPQLVRSHPGGLENRREGAGLDVATFVHWDVQRHCAAAQEDVRTRLTDLDESGAQQRTTKPVRSDLWQFRHARDLSGRDDDTLDADGVGVGGWNLLAFVPANGERELDGVAGHRERVLDVLALRVYLRERRHAHAKAAFGLGLEDNRVRHRVHIRRFGEGTEVHADGPVAKAYPRSDGSANCRPRSRAL